ncbi:MAG: cation diffusion facilitator family transporter [Candidatus Protistobacter heckmanni]|nr:cation diffusion facilitator family transporter [Candidatus Protistobacter heckmanni]
MSAEHLHAHHEGDAGGHARAEPNQRVLVLALLLTLAFAGVEAGAGWFANSLALISDAGHMFTDAFALGLACLAQIIARRPPSERHSFGLGRAEVLAAFINGLLMLALVAFIAGEAVMRLSDPEPVKGGTVTVVAVIGLAVNVLVAWILSRDTSSVNSRAALLHVMGDLLGSVAALAAGLVVSYTGWMPIDPLLSIFVSLLILRSTFSILADAYHTLMEGVPRHIDYAQVGADLADVDGVESVHDLHVWEMAPGQPAVIGHVKVASLGDWPAVLDRIRAMLREKHHIDHITLQPETTEHCASGNDETRGRKPARGHHHHHGHGHGGHHHH